MRCSPLRWQNKQNAGGYINAAVSLLEAKAAHEITCHEQDHPYYTSCNRQTHTSGKVCLPTMAGPRSMVS